MKGRNVVLSQSDQVASKAHGGESWNSGALGNVPNKSFRVKLINRGANGYVMIGMAPKTFALNGQNYSSCGWYLYVGDGTLYSQQADSDRGYAYPVQNGAIIDVHYNPVDKQIGFSFDGTPNGVAFNITTNVDIFPAVEFSDVGASVELVSLL